MKIHPSNDLLEELLLSLGTGHRELLRHVAECEPCRERLRHLPRVARRDEPGGRPSYDCAFADASRRLRDEAVSIRRERKEALGLFVELMERRDELPDLLAQDSRFHTWGVFELLVDRSGETGAQDPTHTEELARLALLLSDRLDTARYRTELIEDLRARAWAYFGNARRVASDLQGADEALATARKHLEKGTGEPIEQAIHLDLEASLRRGQRNFERALQLLDEAVTIFLGNGARHRAGRSIVKISVVHYHAGENEEAISALARAIELIDPEREPRLLLCARHNLTGYIAEAGRYQEALELYHGTRPLYRDFVDAWTQNRRKWLKGKIDHGLGRTTAAEALFRAARDGFLAEGIPYDTALVSLDLAQLYAEQGRTAELKRLAEEMVPIFASRHIHREALAALAYFRQAVEAETATLDLVTQVALYLRRAEHDTGLQFAKG